MTMSVAVTISAMSVSMPFTVAFMTIAFVAIALTVTVSIALTVAVPFVTSTALIPIAGLMAVISVVFMLMAVATLSDVQTETIGPNYDGGFPAAMTCLYFH